MFTNELIIVMLMMGKNSKDVNFGILKIKSNQLDLLMTVVTVVTREERYNYLHFK